MKSLESFYSEMLYMRNVEHKTNREIASSIGCSYYTVYKYLGKQESRDRSKVVVKADQIGNVGQKIIEAQKKQQICENCCHFKLDPSKCIYCKRNAYFVDNFKSKFGS